tara:strand:- start:41 stop:361 length:321 start_codon:yes stop_codon:yes gene_type:complete
MGAKLPFSYMTDRTVYTVLWVTVAEPIVGFRGYPLLFSPNRKGLLTMKDFDKRMAAVSKSLGIKTKVVDYSKTDTHQLVNIATMDNTSDEKRELALAELERRAPKA